MSAPVLVGCSHGTDSPAGRAAIRSILDDVARARPGLDVREAFVDVQQPEVAVVVGELTGAPLASESRVAPLAVPDAVGSAPPHASSGADRGPADATLHAVVVPLLLSTGFHVRVDIAAAATVEGVRAAAPLGPDARLVAILLDRLVAAGLRPDDAVVLAAAGSTDPDAARDVRLVAAGLSVALGRDVVVGFGAGAHPRVPVAVEKARAGLGPGGRVVVAAYLLAPGYFLDRVLEAGGDVVTDPLAPDERLAEVALDRFDAALD